LLSHFQIQKITPDVGYNQDLIYEMCKQFHLDVAFGIVKGRSESSCDLLWTGPMILQLTLQAQNSCIVWQLYGTHASIY
jgi:hypothetical protein